MKYFLPEIPIISNTILPISNLELENIKIISPDKNNEIAIMIVHFLRDQLLLNTLKSIFEYQPGCKIYIADQGVFNKNLNKLYYMLEKNGHQIIYTGFDAGISHCRNQLVKNIKEPYIYWQDDDVLFLSTTNLKSALRILKKYDDLGILGFQEYSKNKITHYEMHLLIENRRIKYIPAWRDVDKNSDITYCDMVINDALAKKEVFNDILWDERLKLAEHLDFFLQIKFNSKWKVAFANIYTQHQDIEILDPNYKLFRDRNKYFFQYYVDKWNIDYLHNLEFKTNKPYKIEVFQENKAVESSEKENIINSKSLELELLSFIKILNQFNYDYCITGITCTELVCNKTIKTIPISISIPRYDKPLIKSLESYGYLCTEDTISIDFITIKLSTEYIIKKKNYINNNNHFYVPCPVVRYLETFNKKPWKELC
jgi:hypothetical protein